MLKQDTQFKVILVDDEPIVLKALRVLIDWEKLGYCVCGEASDGKSALQLILEKSPNVVVTDLRMPGIDGLALIKECREKAPSPVHFIILSGYSDFQYAQQAITYGVTEYLLKPVDEEVLTATLVKMHTALVEEQKQEQLRVGYLRNSVQGYLKALLRADFLPNDYQLQQIKTVLAMRETDVIRYVKLKISEGVHPPTQKTILSYLEKTNSFFCIDINDAIELIYIYNSTDFREVKKFFIALRQEVYKIFDVNIMFMAGLACKDICTLFQSGASVAEMEENYSFYADEDVWIYEEYTHLEYDYDISDILRIDSVVQAIDEGSYIEISNAVDKLFEDLKEKHIPPELVKTILSSIVVEIVRMITQLQGGDSVKIKEYSAYINTVGGMTSSEAKEKMLRLCFHAIQLFSAIRKQNAKGIINDIEKYVWKNYMSDINLKVIADLFHVNPAYLGQQFKKKTGTNFNYFLNHIRIEEAKKYLKNSDLRVYEIAEKVGFKSTDYFTSKFQNAVGQSPVEFREKYSK